MILLTAFKGNNNSSKILLDSISGDNIRKKLLTVIRGKNLTALYGALRKLPSLHPVW